MCHLFCLSSLLYVPLFLFSVAMTERKSAANWPWGWMRTRHLTGHTASLHYIPGFRVVSSCLDCIHSLPVNGKVRNVVMPKIVRDGNSHHMNPHLVFSRHESSDLLYEWNCKWLWESVLRHREHTGQGRRCWESVCWILKQQGSVSPHIVTPSFLISHKITRYYSWQMRDWPT